MASTPTLQIHVALDDIKPPIWRRVWVAADTRLDQLHLILQGAMGWGNYHLHGFRQDERIFTDDPEVGSRMEDEVDFCIGQLLRSKGNYLTYDYDFGDGWEHTVTLEKLYPGLPEPSVELPLLVDGANSCPPEDCGGPWSYSDFLKRVDAKDPETMEWLQGIGHSKDWSPQEFDVELGQQGMMELLEVDDEDLFESMLEEMADSSGEAMPRWNPLEQELALSKLHHYLQEPRWRDMFEFVTEAVSLGAQSFAKGDVKPADLIPGFQDLVRDHVAYDLLPQKSDPVIPAFLNTKPDLPPGAFVFLNGMMGSVFAPFRVFDHGENGELQLIEMITGTRLSASFTHPAPDPSFRLERGALLLARVVPCGDEFRIVGPSLTCDFEPEELDHMLNLLVKGCRVVGGNPDNYFELMKPSVPHLVGFWVMQTREDGEFTLPMAPQAGEEWDPGASVYFVEAEAEAKAALNACAEIETLSDGIWQRPAENIKVSSEDESSPSPRGWIFLNQSRLQLWAGGRDSMKELRRIIKKAKLPTTRHISTRYGLEDEFPLS